MEEDRFFLLGVCFGALVMFFACVVLGGLPSEIVDNVDEISLQETLYTVTVDNVPFTCDMKPTIKDDKVILWGCAELFGDKTVIKGYTSVELVTVNK